MKRLLVLEDGSVFEGEAFGADLYVSGELVFSTAMTGYQELITDQAFSGQILSFTFPVIGAAGINRDDSESITPTCLAVVVQHLVEMPSNWRQQMTLDEFLKRKKIPGIMGIDTRQVAKIVRKYGRMKATVINKGDSIDHILDQLRATVLPKDQVRQVSTKTAYAVPGFGKSIALIDLGVKHSVLRQLSQRDCNVTVYPYDSSQWAWRSSSGKETLPLNQKTKWSNSDLGHGLGSTGLGSSLWSRTSPHGSWSLRIEYSCS